MTRGISKIGNRRRDSQVVFKGENGRLDTSLVIFLCCDGEFLDRLVETEVMVAII